MKKKERKSGSEKKIIFGSNCSVKFLTNLQKLKLFAFILNLLLYNIPYPCIIKNAKRI